MFRLSQRGGGIDNATTIEGAREIIRDQPLGRYEADGILPDSFPSSHTSRRWELRSEGRTGSARLIPIHDPHDDRGMLEELPNDLMSKLGYRIANGEAARFAEMATFDHGLGRGFAAGIGGEAETIERDVLRRDGPWTHLI
jgi:hypothetical protein